jgi:ATP-dependent Clp protease ATP-binding subunit ClpA
MLAKRAMWRLRHPVLTSEHLFYACLRRHDQPHWDLCRNLPVTAETVWAHLRDSPPVSEESEEFYSVQLGKSAKAALDKAEEETARREFVQTGPGGLMRALLAESEGPVRRLLDSAHSARSAMSQEGATAKRRT